VIGSGVVTEAENEEPGPGPGPGFELGLESMGLLESLAITEQEEPNYVVP
jgi:hypothetical protein